ncbi:hypothetical protein [Nocardioides plantarum]|uniref:DUF1524 domain-containing protein n=1 Tax=Nocardioides plantarum TaxID=29299 RepID=A0ABV5KG32_9ACTN|nr:hypothetical protein [Nocardioides plantarum]
MVLVSPAVRRPTARVLPVSPGGAVLLLQDQDPAHPGILRWGSVGGAVEVDHVLAAGWWTPDDLGRDGTAVAPELTHAMRAAVAGIAAAEGAP